MNLKIILVLIFLVLLLSSCGLQEDNNTNYPISAYPEPIRIDQTYPGSNIPTVSSPKIHPSYPMDAPEPLPGFGSISGTLYSFTTGITLAKTNFYLIPGDGPNRNEMPPILVGPSEKDIQGITDQNGQFFIDKVPPGNYFLIVESPYSYSPAVTSETDFTPLLLAVKENKKYPLGVIQVSWP